VTGLAAELHRLHLVDGPIGDEAHDQRVDQSGDAEEKPEPPPGHARLDGGLSAEAVVNAAPRQVDAERHQQEPGDEQDWNDDEDDDADVRVRSATALDRQDDQPRNQCGDHQEQAEHAQPVARHHHEQRPFAWVGRVSHRSHLVE
jgi:hypothetical protein